MSSTPVSANSDTTVAKMAPEHDKTQITPRPEAGWKRFVTPLLVMLLWLS